LAIASPTMYNYSYTVCKAWVHAGSSPYRAEPYTLCNLIKGENDE